ncbi:MAG: hypothetical protein HYU57_07795 [Micavibrio aeruginosavorus]|nr:hypothetical protein [Micavibrio aeruginosavorus]
MKTSASFSFRRVAAGLAAGTAFVTALHLAGESDAYCAADPSCRPMTAGEIALARPLFGDSIDYAKVRIFNRESFLPGNAGTVARASRNNLFLGEKMGEYRRDFGAAVRPSATGAALESDHAGDFVHELTHVWQYQNGVPQGKSKSLSYDFDIGEKARFLDYNSEQQAEIMLTLFERRRALANFIHYAQTRKTPVDAGFVARRIAEDCALLAPYEDKAAQVLPIRKLPTCTPPGTS